MKLWAYAWKSGSSKPVVLAGRVGSNPTPGARTIPKHFWPLEQNEFGRFSLYDILADTCQDLGFSTLSEPGYDPDKEESFPVSRWREAERTHMIEAIKEPIDEARKKAKPIFQRQTQNPAETENGSRKKNGLACARNS